MGFKSFLVWVIVILVLWIAGGIYFAYMNLYPDVSNWTLIYKFPIYLWDFIKHWVTSL